MKGVVKTLKSFYVWVFLLIGIVGGCFVYAQTMDTTVYTPEELIIIPDSVTSDTWQGLEHVLSQDLRRDSLWQEFGESNSAYVQSGEEESPEASLEPASSEEIHGGDDTSEEVPPLSEEPSSEEAAPAESSPVETDAASAPPEPEAAAESEATQEPATEAEEATEPVSAPEPIASRPSERNFLTNVVATVARAFPFAQQAVEEPAAEPASDPEVVPAEGTDTGAVDAIEDVAEETPPDASSSPEPHVPAVLPEVSEAEPAEPAQASTAEHEDTVEPELEIETEFAMQPCEPASGCERYEMTFSGFTMPDFETVTTLDAVQVRLSLAAKERADNFNYPQRFVIEYTYASGTDWTIASVIDINDEVSNSLNGDYFLATLALPPNFAALSNLQVRVSYEGDRAGLEGVYVEGVWLEVNAGSFYDEVSEVLEVDTITYERELLAPHLHTLDGADLDPALSTLPSFTLSYDPQQNFFRRVFNDLFGENAYTVEKIELHDSDGAPIDVPFGTEYRDDTTWTVSMLKQPQGLKPGKYTVTVAVKENDAVYTDSFEFYWGMLAINPKKSMYHPLERVEIHMAALTDTGDTICDADLSLRIIDPKHNVYEVPIEHSGECGANNVTDVPDYKAVFSDTGEWGTYTMQLEHRNVDGEVVHTVHDSFEVRDYIPFDIERTAPTRIYPPAPYQVGIMIQAYRDFTGDITERVPRGFEVTGLEGAEISSLPEYTLITWKDVTMKAGDELTLHYQFDAPDVSPYMYLLGPLDMEGFAELRQWQIASDALTSVAWLTGTRTVNGTNLNAAPSPLQWSTSTVDGYYFQHSTTSNSHRLTVEQDGDYFVSVNLPLQRTDGNNSRTRIGAEVRVNGTAVPDGLGRSGYIRNQGNHTESSSNVSFLLNGLEEDDYIEVYVEGLTTIDAGNIVNVSGQAGLYVEHIESSQNVFSATTTQATTSVNLNTTVASALSWTETRQDSGFVHSDSVNPERITLSNAGTYIVHINVPLSGDTLQQNILGRVRLDGTQVPGGIFAQGYLRAEAAESDQDSSMHWSGVVVSTTSNQVLTITTEREANSGTTTVTSGFVGSIYIEQLATADAIVLRGRSPGGGTDWSDTPAETIAWDTQVAYSTTTFTHSTSSNADDIVVNIAGDYLLTYNDAMSGTAQRINNRITVEVDGVTVPGAKTSSHYIRNQNNHNNSSGAFVWLLTGLTPGQTINILTEQEANTAVIDDTTDAIVTLTKKAELNLRPAAPSMFNTPFDNIRFASTTPYFLFQASDPDGSFDIQYQFSISTSSDFSASTTRTSGVDSGFANTASSTDTSPFIENNQIRFQLQGGDALSDLTTYYWRVRAKDVNGSNEFGDWSTTQSLTVDLAAEVPNWYQALGGQFESDTFVGTVSSGNDGVQVDASVSSEILAVYGEGSQTAPRYRFWDGDSWSTEASAQSVTSAINWLSTAASVSRDEYVMVTLDQANDAYAQVYSASTSNWGNLTLLSPVVSSNAYRGVAVAYESLSGDAMAVSCTNSPDPVYRIWNGSSWSATGTINASSVNNCNFLAIASDPASDEIILVVRDTGTQYEALVWDGNSWIDNRVIGSSAKVAREGMAVAYESSGNQAVIAVSNGTNNSVLYTTWNGTEFSVNTPQAIGNDFEFGNFAVDPNSDKLTLCYIDEDNDIGALRWDGGVWSTFSELTTTGNSDLARAVDCEFETVAGRSGYIMAAYSDTGTDGDYHAVFATSSWVSAQAGSDINDAFWVQTERAGDGTIVGLHFDDENDRIDATYWNGTSWANREALETTLSSTSTTPYEAMSMSAKRFQFTEGTVTTPPISFNFVSNQPTWGDISFSTTEPFGTDVKVKVRYTATTTCDSYISNAVLPGNSAGFDVASSSISLVSLSTSTYSQICLEARLTTQGAASAILDEWTLSWVREPKLIQQAYRWYVNGSFLTPTDAWPSGITDLAENVAIGSAYSVNLGEAIRLRMSLRGSNVALPIGSDAFKLQYAEGFTCSPSLVWHDVGDSASSTALWRGYENSIVGSDWYDGAWGRRVKITVNESLVSEGLTDFPVYLDLDDLPAAFFANVQSDGDDIRITEADGVTEVPYELVSIDTGATTGELHFKADLASTTDTEFFIYYGNSGAAGYAASATYGSQNVWTNNYSLRYPLDENPAGASPQFIDSTSNSNDAVARAGMTSGDVVAGMLGNAIDLDGNDGGVFETQLAYGGAFTASMWWNASGDGFAIAGPAGTNEKMGPWNSPAGRIFTRAVSSSDTTPVHPTDGTWTYVVMTRDASNVMRMFHNGTTTTLFSAAAQVGTSDWHNFGGETSQGFNGRIDELRFASVQRSGGWIATEYNNQSNPTGFYAISAEELISDGRVLPSTLLADSDYEETYEEINPTNVNAHALAVGDDAEWDFSIENNAAVAATDYCFRLVYEDGAALNSYENYPRLITNAPPPAPEMSAPFDNERLASTTPWFEFAATDEAGDDVSYQVQVDNNYDFSSTVIDRNSIDHFTFFTNLLDPSERSQYTTGQTIRFVPTTNLSNSTTYWWRVRAMDDFGSGTFGDWSTPQSFTVTTSTAITTWYQTTGEQFLTDSLLDAIASTSTHDVGIDTGLTAATTTSTVIDFDDKDTGNAWGALSWNDNETSGTIDYYVEYRVSGDTFALIPDSALPGNAAGFNTSPVSLIDLDTDAYNEIRLVAAFSGSATLPRLLDWTVTWGETIEAPTLVTPFDNAKVSTTTPSFTFITSDPENNDLQYELQFSSTYSFAASSTFLSGVNAGFTNLASSTDTSPFTSSTTIRYTAQSALTNGNTYWWRVRARDPGGSNTWSEYSEPQSFTVDIAISVSAWFQTTGEQFDTDELVDIETTAGAAQITSTITEVLMAYGEGTGQAPRYRTWNGSEWSTAGTAESVGAQIRWTKLEASPTRPEYALATIGTDQDVNVQIYNSETDSWGNVHELEVGFTDTARRGVDVAYETNSGDLIAVSCSGTNAVYSVWNGTSWTATSSITLANANNCLVVELASDPTSDEIVAVFRHTNTGAADYEAMVWNGSSWGNSIVFGNMTDNNNYGMAAAYEESGGQALVAVSNGNAANFLWSAWNGSSWTATTATTTLEDDFEWGSLRRDVGTDRLALCYGDQDSSLGVVFWSGSSWGTYSEVEATGNAQTSWPIDCAFETNGSRDGYLMVPYADTTDGRYQFYATSTPSGEQSLDTMNDSWRVHALRSGDGLIHTAFMDDVNDRIDVSQWDGTSWTARETITTAPSVTGTPFDSPFSMAAQLYPNFTQGSIRSTQIDFNDGAGPRWDEVTWNDSTPGASVIEYRVYYLASTSVYTLIPDSALPGNAAGFTTSPIDISGLDRTVYEMLQLDAQFICNSGNCPTVNDWAVLWSEGITVSGLAYEYDGVSTTTSGTVAVAVNGALQSGKTGTIQPDGTWSIANVTAFEGDTVVVFVDNATGTDEAVGITTYDGVGDMTSMELTKRHLTIGSSDTATTTNLGFAGYDNTDDEDLFFTVGVANALTVCAESSCADHRLKVKQGSVYEPNANVITHDFANYGTFRPASTTMRVSGSWNQQGTFVEDTSTMLFTATSGAETIAATGTAHSFYNVTFGESTSTAAWTLAKPLDVNGTLAIDQGVLVRGTSTFSVARDLRIGAGGGISGIATTTFDGSGSFTWYDYSSSSTNIGHAVIDGTAKTVTLGGNTAAQSVTIGSDDTLNASGSGYNIKVYANWTNNNSFVPQTGTVNFVGTTTGTIARGTSAFNNLSFTGAGGVWSFSTSTLSVNGNFTIATGTVTMPTATTTIGGNFSNTGGTFAHNNSVVLMSTNGSGRTITQNGNGFLNSFYNLIFSGSGAWSFTESTATTSQDLRIQGGTVTFPSGQLIVGGDLYVSGSGAFSHNSGEVVLLVQDSDEVRANGSSFNNLRTRGAASGSWYSDNWNYRIPINIQESQIDGDLTNFPVYVNLDDLSSHFFSNVRSDGGDIRMTTSDGITEVPTELVSIDTSGTQGELYFRASNISSTTNTTFYLYYGNSATTSYASTTAYGAQNVWSNGYLVVNHMNDITMSLTRNSRGAPNGDKSSAANPAVTASGRVYSAQDISGDSVQHAGTLLSGTSSYTVSLWFNPDNLTGSGDTATYGFSLYGISTAAPYQWLTAGGTGFGSELRICAYENTATSCTGTTGASIATGNWYHVSTAAFAGGTTTVRVNGTQRLSYVNDNETPVSANFTIGDLRPARNINFDGRIDEVRVQSGVRSDAWRDAEYRNTATSTTFYSVSAYQTARARNFTDANATVLGSFVLETGGDAVFPQGTLSIGGSFDNNAEFIATSSAVRFNSTAGAETIAAGSSTFATLTFDAVGGDFTITENATATVAVNLANAAQFTLQSGRVLEASGTFTNAVASSSTTWTGSTLMLTSNTDYAINAKTHGGDIYGTLLTDRDTDVTMWNSSAAAYTTASTSSIYSADHAAADGDLYIFGNYLRASGTEYWSYGTDFDGAALSATTSRQVDVRIATSSTIGFSSSSLNITGTTSASTTIDAQTGSFSLSATNTTVTASYFTASGTDSNGLRLVSSSTLSTFRNAFFYVRTGRSGITLDASTVNTNPAAQFNYVGFATTTAGAASNVTLVGSPASYVWFRLGTGGLYGEAFDNGDGNPGSIRFDDSSYLISVSGTVYSNDGFTTMGGPTCDGVTPNVRIVIDGGTYASSTSCNGSTGAYSFTNVAYVGDPGVVVYLDTNGGAAGSVVSKTPTTNITNMNIYQNRVITRHESTAPLTIADMADYDYDNDTDLKFTAATTTLTLLPNTELFVFASTTFAPGGNLNLLGSGNSNGYEGTLQLGSTSTFQAAGTETHTLAGRFVARNGAAFNAASSTFIFNATTSGKSITASSSLAFNELQFTGSGGGWHITTPLTVYGSMNVANGTVTGTSNITVQTGSLYGNGVLSLGSGTTTIERTNTLGGSSAWTFNNLQLGNGSVVGTTTPGGTATTTILGRLSIAAAHFLDGNDSRWNLSGTSTVFTESGTFLEDTTVVRYSGNNANVLNTTYYDLKLDAAAGSSTFTGLASGISVLNDLTISGTASTTANFAINDPVLIVGNDVLINASGTLIASDSATTTIAGSYDNNGRFVGSNGIVAFTGSGTKTIAAGNSSFSNLTVNGTGSFTVTENATATAAVMLANHANFTVASSTTLSIGGQFTNTLGGGATTFTGSTLRFTGSGSITINSSSTGDSYDTIAVAAGRRVKMWNSAANTYSAAGGIYSMDHGSTNGLLHVYGTYNETTGSDHWSYAADFDGTSLAGGSERAATVRFASGASLSYSGGTLAVVGTSTASTTIENQGSGTYSLAVGGTASTTFDYVAISDTNASGTVFGGTPTVNNFSHTDHLVEINNATAITVGGTVIDQNQAKNFTGNIFNSATGTTGATNVTATGTSVSSWRFTNHNGNLDGETLDQDAGGDPGYIVWDDSAALITVSGTVYSDEGSTVSTNCDGTTSNVVLRVAGLTSYSTTCNATSGAYSIPNVAFSPNDTLTLYLDGETQKAATVSVDPVSSIGNMHLYESRVIVRHEGVNPISIADMSVWDSSDDADIPFTAVDSTPDTLTLPADRKLIVWTGKTFEPAGNVTVSGGGGGAAHDGTLEAQANATFRATGSESHTIGGSLIFGTNAVFTPGLSTTTFTTSAAARTIDVNGYPFYNAAFTGSGSWTMTDPAVTFAHSFTQSAGTVTFPTGTTTVGRSFNATGGAFTISNSPLYFISTTTGNIVRFDDSSVASLRFQGTGGSWNMTDSNATATQAFVVASGTVSLPSGLFAVGGDFRNAGGALTHNTSEIILTATSTAFVRASSSDLYGIRFAGPAAFTLEDVSSTYLESFTVASGTVTAGTGTLSVGGSFSATGGTFSHSSGTVLLNATSTGRTVNPGTNSFYNLQISAPAGGYTFSSATTTSNFTLASVNSFTLSSGQTLAVGGVFTNSVGGAPTTWTGSTLRLMSGSSYSANSRTTVGDTYGTLVLGANTDVRIWNSSAATTSVDTSASLYSQDHANRNGDLYIYGDLHIATTTEYWSYATDFDGTSLSGSERQVRVYMAPNATTTFESGTLNIVGVSASTTNIAHQSTGTYAFAVTGGTFNANYYSFDDMNALGLQLSGTPTISELSNGYFELSVTAGSLISLSSTTLNANASKVFTNVGFSTSSGALTGYNVNLSGETSNAWRFSSSYGSIDGEGFDVDGVDQCGSIRFDDSSCLLTSETHYRWRNDDGGEGAPDSEWYSSSWNYRKRVRFDNTTAESAATTAVKMTVTYDSDMQSDFDDLRFTDDDGTSLLSHWVERYTPSTNAVVWVEVPTLAANDITTVFMYYGSSTAASVSSAGDTFAAVDDFEDGNITEYSGDTSLFQTDTSPVYGGTRALEAQNVNGRTTDGIYRTDLTVSQGQVIRWMQYIDISAGSGDEACTLFGIQSPGSNNNNYAVCLEQFGADRISLSKNVYDNDVSGTVLATTSVTYSTGWYEVEVDWQTNNNIKAYLYNSAGTLVASTSATDSTYTTGGIGFTFWFQHGAWDSYTARTRGGGRPTVYFGAEQQDGGASWAGALDAAAASFQQNDTARLRVSVENSGLDIDDQEFLLEYAEKGMSPSCESVSNGSYASVPVAGSCGTSPVCMATSTYLTNGDPTTDLLFDTEGTFTAGQLVESPSNDTGQVDIDQNHYTELEYVLTPTIYSDDALCFRVTNSGTELDFYDNVAEMALQFDPVLSSFSLNGGNPILLTLGTTTLVYATGTVVDSNGYSDFESATTTFYRSGIGAACSADANNCYRSYTATSSCTFTDCSGSSCTLSCVANMQYHADPTDNAPYEGEEWLAFVEIEDAGGGYDFTTTPGVELITLRALTVDSAINYGSLGNDQDTGAVNATTTVTNLGNDGLDVDIEATDLIAGVSYIPASQQKFATSTFTYNTCTTCSTLSSSSLTSVPLDLPKPTVSSPFVTDDLYWGIYVPLGVLPTAHQGFNTFYAIGD